jgi:predicted MPP superfamily phosphohydrolase
MRSVEMINELKPDIVFFTGDLVNSKAEEMDDYIDIFDKIEAPHGVYSILGNHDYGDYHRWPNEEEKQANFENLKDQHKKLGWKLLLNEHVQVNIGDSTLGVIGVENYSASNRFHKYGDMAKSVDGMSPSDVKILLSHDPSHWTDQIITNYSDVDLTLSGHTHGFQFGVEIPGYIKWSPAQYMYKQWAGLYQKGRQYLYVNRGLGFLGYPGRVGILPEITFLTLNKAN